MRICLSSGRVKAAADSRPALRAPIRRLRAARRDDEGITIGGTTGRVAASGGEAFRRDGALWPDAERRAILRRS
jgi:hypothetical protein